MGGEATLSRRQKSSSQVEKGEVTLVGNLRSKPHDIDIQGYIIIKDTVTKW